jgi:hypothetical protein
MCENLSFRIKVSWDVTMCCWVSFRCFESSWVNEIYTRLGYYPAKIGNYGVSEKPIDSIFTDQAVQDP